MKIMSVIAVFFTVVVVAPSFAQDQAPSLVGKWAGEWGGSMRTPVEVVINSVESGTVMGTITITYQGVGYYSTFTSVIGYNGGRVSFTIKHNLGQVFNLTLGADGALEGTGESNHHRGGVRLTRNS